MLVEVSLGELVDKLTILKIKSEKISDPQKLANVNAELKMLSGELEKSEFTLDSPYFTQLLAINNQLWQIEDQLRIKEVRQEFDGKFIELARAVYFRNDERAEVKKRINIEFHSTIVEEKQYCEYK